MMKTTLAGLFAFAAVCSVSNAAIVSSAISGTVDQPTITGGGTLGDSSYALLVVDGNGDGIEGVFSTTLSEGSFYGDNLVAAVFASTDSFFGTAASSPVVSVSWDDALPGTGQANNGDKYYVVWFEGTAGTASNADTSYSPTAGATYWYASGADWLVPAAGGTATPPSVNTGFTSATVVIPEPSIALLGGLGLIGLIRRRR